MNISKPTSHQFTFCFNSNFKKPLHFAEKLMKKMKNLTTRAKRIFTSNLHIVINFPYLNDAIEIQKHCFLYFFQQFQIPLEWKIIGNRRKKILLTEIKFLKKCDKHAEKIFNPSLTAEWFLFHIPNFARTFIVLFIFIVYFNLLNLIFLTLLLFSLINVKFIKEQKINNIDMEKTIHSINYFLYFLCLFLIPIISLMLNTFAVITPVYLKKIFLHLDWQKS